jgi:UDP-N-acetylglucosamine diphosphorylase / glucose-1-phosphate thymidylyltransferase / UDP-N-acetylgalactosamine diphosphorylase / glucosamine-1-phosphate N-acetyltransferase / galactosamine-1-phosphate N-acetyltransferase
MNKQILIFEDGSHQGFYPIAQTRPLWEIRCGAFLFNERIIAATQPSSVSYSVRPSLADLCVEKGYALDGINPGEELLLVNALLAAHYIDLPENTVAVSGTRIAAARLSAEYMKKLGAEILSPSFDSSAFIESTSLTKIDMPEDWFLPSYIWECVLNNGKMIGLDFPLIDKSHSAAENYSVTFAGNREHIVIEDGVRIDPFVFIDAVKGPVIIRKGCEISPFTKIEGPCYIGEGTIITGAKIREGCSFGPVCRLGGEIEDAVFQSYSNKYHDGFIGHAYIGEWVNLGAMTTNSDLKNDYSNVHCVLPSGKVDTGSGKVGCVIGDFSKTSIGTLLNTGSIVGTGSMIVFSGRMTPPLVPDFSRFIKNELRSTGSAAGCVSANKIVCARRGKELSSVMEKLLHEIYREGNNVREDKISEWNAALK